MADPKKTAPAAKPERPITDVLADRFASFAGETLTALIRNYGKPDVEVDETPIGKLRSAYIASLIAVETAVNAKYITPKTAGEQISQIMTWLLSITPTIPSSKLKPPAAPK